MRMRTFLTGVAVLLCTGWAQAQTLNRTAYVDVNDTSGNAVPGLRVVAKTVGSGEEFRVQPLADGVMRIEDVGDKFDLTIIDPKLGHKSCEIALPQIPSIKLVKIAVIISEKGADYRIVAALPAPEITHLGAIPDASPFEYGDSVPLQMNCASDALFAQDPEVPTGSWSAANSDVEGGYIVYEDYAVSGDIEGISFWGLQAFFDGFGWINCSEDPMTFEVKFWADSGGQPGAEMCSYTIPISGVFTGNTYSGFSLYEYTAVLSPACSNYSGWVSVQATGGASCWFLWMNGTGGNGHCYQSDGLSLSDRFYDQSICLTGQYIPVYGACCDDSDGTCTDNVEALDCAAPLRFAANTLCADLDPACGSITTCEHSVVLWDDYGDGWNGGTLTVSVNGTPVLSNITLSSGYGPQTFYFQADTGDNIVTTYSPGSWSYENYYYIYDGVGLEICSDGLGGVTPSGCTATGNCGGGGGGCDHTIVLTDDYGDGWNGGTVSVLVNGTTVLNNITLASGYGPETYTFQAATGDTISTAYVAGSWSYENEYHIYDVNGTEICADGTGGTTPVGGPCGTGFCEADPCIGNEPANDECVDAILISTPYPQSVCGTNECANVDCPGVLDWNATWWEITLPYDVNDLTIDFCGNGFEINNVGVVVYDDCTDCSAYTLYDGIDWYSCSDGIISPIITWDRLAGPGTVYFPVYFNNGEEADYCFSVDVDEVIVPPNDLCENAIPVAVPSDTDGTTVGGDVDSVPFCGTSSTSPGVWYTVTGTGNTMTATLCNGWNEYDSKLNVYCGDCLDLVCIDGNDDSCGYLSEVTWCSQYGATYYILVHGYGGAAGTFTLSISDDAESCQYDVACMPEGACCLPDSSCVILPAYDCALANGWYQGDDTTCGGEDVEEFVTGRSDVYSGTLDSNSPIWDRVFGCNVSPTCNSSCIDSSSNGQYYEAIPISTTTAENLVCTVEPTGTTIGDTTITLYCDPFDPLDPLHNAVAYDDDGGSGFLSAFTASDGIALTPGAIYWLILSTFSGGATGDFTITFEGDVTVGGSSGPGACCFQNGTCQDLSYDDCTALGGAFGGSGTDCATYNCVILPGACCLPDGTCNVTTIDCCAYAGGFFLGGGTNCGTGTVNALFEDFEDFSDWTVTDVAGTGVVWTTIALSGEGGNYCSTGEAATASSDGAGTFAYDTYLISPVIDLSGGTNPMLELEANFQNFAGRDFFEIDVTTDGSTWTNLLSWNEDHGSFRNTPGEHISLSLGTGSATTQVRFRYYDPVAHWNWYAQVDDVAVTVEVQGESPCDLYMDVKPGACPNWFNRVGHGLLPIALLGTQGFDVALIDPATVTLSRWDGVGGSLAPTSAGPGTTYEDVGTPYQGGVPCGCHDLGGDGFMDLLMQFNGDDVTAVLELDGFAAGSEVPVLLSGYLVNGMPFVTGDDCIHIVEAPAPPGLVRVRTNFRDAGSPGPAPVPFTQVSPPDNTWETGGFGPLFERGYDMGTQVSVTFPQLPGYNLQFIKLDGVRQKLGKHTLNLTVSQSVHNIVAVYMSEAGEPFSMR